MKTTFKVNCPMKPVILDVTNDAHGQHVMWDGRSN